MAWEKPPLQERANTYFLIAAALGAVGVLPYLIGQAEVTLGRHPWQNGWVRLALAIWLLAAGVLLWGVGLYALHRVKARRGRTASRREAERRQQATMEAARKSAEEHEERVRRVEIESHRWQPSAYSSGQGNEWAIALELRSPQTSKGSEFLGSVATCVVTRSENVYRVREPVHYGPSCRYPAFVVLFPQAFEPASQFEPPPQLVPGEYFVTWESDVVGEPRKYRFVIDRFRMLHA
jgi:membrane protein implicated in regulation of membrane protease activity